ncbi:MAG: hypothetical protein ACM3X6_09725, partial [Patescibacteria group bacterium]
NLLITSLVMVFVTKSGTEPMIVGQIDVQAFVMIIVLGLLSFRTSFRFLLANGFSRKLFFGINFAALTVTAAAWTGIIMLIAAAYKAFVPYRLLFSLIYKDAGGAPAWIFTELLFTAVLGWTISMIYYRCNILGKIFVSVAPFVLATLIVLIDSRIGWGISRSLSGFFMAAFGLSADAPQPYRGVLTMLLGVVLLGGCAFLLLRRAQIKD